MVGSRRRSKGSVYVPIFLIQLALKAIRWAGARSQRSSGRCLQAVEKKNTVGRIEVQVAKVENTNEKQLITAIRGLAARTTAYSKDRFKVAV